MKKLHREFAQLLQRNPGENIPLRPISDRNSKLHCLIGRKAGKNRCALVLNELSDADKIKGSNVIDIMIEPVMRDIFVLVFEVTTPEYRNMFYLLMQDLIRFAKDARTETSALKKFLARYKSWQTLLQKKTVKLNAQEQQGLFGELRYLEYLLKQGISAERVLLAWHQEGTEDQDFVFNDKALWIEVKTIKHSAQVVKISSRHQLDNQAIGAQSMARGVLAVIRIQTEPVEELDSIQEVSERILQLCRKSRNADLTIYAFRAHLAHYGIQLDGQNRAIQTNYQFLELRQYDALATGFPRIQRKDVPNGIEKLTYSIQIAALEPYRIEGLTL